VKRAKKEVRYDVSSGTAHDMADYSGNICGDRSHHNGTDNHMVCRRRTGSVPCESGGCGSLCTDYPVSGDFLYIITSDSTLGTEIF
jgi:hypothetical protein